jgi:predicted TIM-barrel fold metal-dependent hydrolase
MSKTPTEFSSLSSFVDTHAHVFRRSLQLADERRYTPDYDASLDTYLELLNKHNFGYGVLVQPSFLGTDNSHMLEALAREPLRLRGIAVVSPSISDDELERLVRSGVAGIRLNLIGRPLPDLRSSAWTMLFRRLAVLGLHVELHRNACDLPALIEPLLEQGLPVVVDHFGRPAPDKGTSDSGFGELLAFGASDQVWVKISGAYRCAEPGTSFVREATEQLLRAYGPARLMWGSDWPHTQFEYTTDFALAISTLQDIGSSPEITDAILCSTPLALYRFDINQAPRSASAADSLFRTL